MREGHVEEELLNRYFDGDLRAAQAEDVARHLQGCAECSQRHRELSGLRDLIALSAQESARDVDFEALFGRIERGIRQAEAPGLLERFAVWWRDLVEQRPGQLLVPLGGLAAAGVALLLLRGGPTDEPSPEARRIAPGIAVEEPSRTPPREPAALAMGNSEIEQVDFGDNAGTVFEIALADGVSTPVVWINDDVQ